MTSLRGDAHVMGLSPLMMASQLQPAPTSASVSASGSELSSPDPRRQRLQHHHQGIPAGFSIRQTPTSVPSFVPPPSTTTTFSSTAAAPASHTSAASLLTSTSSHPQSQPVPHQLPQPPSSEIQTQTQAQQQLLPSSLTEALPLPLSHPQSQQLSQHQQHQHCASNEQSSAPSLSTSTTHPTSTSNADSSSNSNSNSKEHHHQPTIDEVEAVIRQATSTRPTPDGRPPPGKDTRTQLFVGNLPYRVRWQDLKDLFRRSGTVLRADVALSPDNRSRGHGTVLLATAEDAGRAMDMFHGYNWQGRVLEVRLDRMGPQLGDVSGVGVGMGALGGGMMSGAMGAGMGASMAGVGIGGMGMDVMGANGVYNASPGVGGLYVPSPHPTSNFLSPSSSGQLAGSSPLPSLTSSLSTSSSIASSLSSSGVGLSLPTSLTPAQLQVLLQQRLQQQQQQQQLQQPAGLGLGQGQSQGFGLELSLQQVQQLQQLQHNKELSNEDVYALITALAANNSDGSGNFTSASSSTSNYNPGVDAFGYGDGSIGAGTGLRTEYGLGSGALERERLGLSPSMGGLSYGMGVSGAERPMSGLGGLGGIAGLAGPAGLGAGGVGMRSLFVGNLPFHCQWQDLKDLFRQAGTILRADVALGPDGRSRGFGTVSFASETDAERAVGMFNGYDFNGRTLKVHYDKFSSQTPLPPQSAGMTPIQPAAATLLQAAQLQQLISAGSSVGSPLSATGGGFGNGSAVHDAYGSSRPSTSSSSVGASLSATLPLTASLQASILQQHQQHTQRRTSSAEVNSVLSSGKDSRSSGLSSVSPLNASALNAGNPGVIGTSPRLARLNRTQMQSQSGEQREQQVEGRTSGHTTVTTSRRSSSNSATSVNGPSTLPQNPNERPSASSASLTVSPTSSSPLRQTHTSSGSSSADPSRASTQSQTLEAPKSRRPSTASMSTSPRAQHPAHPGTIALPPPPPANAFPYTPHQYHYAMAGAISPLGHPGSPLLYSAYVMQSPGHPYPPQHPGAMQTPGGAPPTYAQMAGYVQSQDPAQGQGQGAHMVTPYGLPPITPSMPSFSFVPQPSPAGPMGGSSAMPPTPAENGMNQEHSHSSAGAVYQHSGMSAGAGQAAQQQSQNAVTPMSYPYNAVMGIASPPIHFPSHMFSPFTPGTALSPGAFWGHPGHVGHGAPHLNPAVGSRPLHHAYAPGSQPTSPAAGGFFPVMEPSGYFPPVPPQQGRQEYFPPVPAPVQSSGLANEVTYQEGGRESGSAVLVDGIDGVDRSGERERTRSSSSSFSVQSSAQGEGDESGGGGGRASSVATSWRSSDERVPTKAGLANVDTASTGTLKSLAGEMASVRLGEPPKGKKSQGVRRGCEKDGPSPASATGAAVGRRESVAVDDEERASNAGAPGQQSNRSHSMGEASSSRPQTLQKTHSDETVERIVLDARATKSAGAVQKLVS